jgi:hypothetical protein
VTSSHILTRSRAHTLSHGMQHMERLSLCYNLLLDAGIVALAQVLAGGGAAVAAAPRPGRKASLTAVHIDCLSLEACGLGAEGCQALVHLLLKPQLLTTNHLQSSSNSSDAREVLRVRASVCLKVMPLLTEP